MLEVNNPLEVHASLIQLHKKYGRSMLRTAIGGTFIGVPATLIYPLAAIPILAVGLVKLTAEMLAWDETALLADQLESDMNKAVFLESEAYRANY